jgi:hypothetical protein
MTERDQRPDARPLFRRLAVAVAILCFLIAGAFGWFGGDDKWFGIGISLFVGFVMLTIYTTGSWPGKR